MVSRLSLANIINLKRETLAAITKIRNDADAMENNWRTNEEVTCNQRFNEIH